MKVETMLITLTDDNFQKEVLENRYPVLVEFGADWCGTCHIYAPMMKEFAVDFKGQIQIGRLNVDKNGLAASEYGIVEIPTLLFFKNGQVVDHIIGAVPKKELMAKVKAILEPYGEYL